MSQDPPVLNAKELPDWSALRQKGGAFTKIVIGSLDSDAAHPGDLPQDFATIFPNLTHLHLWGLAELTRLPVLPPNLKVLDVRNCKNLKSIGNIPAQALEELVIWDAESLQSLPLEGDYPKLWDLSLTNCPALPESTLRQLLTLAPNLTHLDFSGCQSLGVVRDWPCKLERIELNRCTALKQLPLKWPGTLRRLGLRGAKTVNAVSELPETIDSIDLQDAAAVKDPGFLERLARSGRRPRTVIINGSGLALPNELFGKVDSNRAPEVFAHLESNRVPDHEVKVILLGNGRSGKSSLARMLVEGKFDEHEATTHGIRLWTTTVPFTPVDAPAEAVDARINIWDFAGQDLYYTTHRLFMQSKAVYVICEACSGKGADPEGDAIDDDGLESGYDTDRWLGYWMDQVASLGAPSPDLPPPPVIFVRTKVDRDSEPETQGRRAEFLNVRKDLLKNLSRVDFSAKTGEGLDDLKSRLSEAIASVLGIQSQREIAEGGKAVKSEIQKWLDLNSVEHRIADDEKRPARPPHPILERADFNQIVKEKCPEGSYRKDPDLLLDFLHQSGFLYANPQALPETIVLDQRWAIQGIYTAFDRKTAWPLLLQKRGRCALADLQKWGWKAYDENHRKIFLRFMLACGMAYSIGARRDGAEEFVVLRALPEDRERMREIAAQHRGRRPESGSPVVLEDRKLGRDAALGLLGDLASKWGRSAILWQWGGQFESYRNYVSTYDDPDRERTFVEIDWEPSETTSFGGRLTIRLFGKDETFRAAILNRCRDLGGFEPLRDVLETQAAASAAATTADLQPELDMEFARAPAIEPADKRATQDHEPLPSVANCVEFGISFAGDRQGGSTSRGGVPKTSIEYLPLKLAEVLRSMGVRVEEYRSYQDLPEHARGTSRGAYIADLVAKDHVMAFLSRAYLRSPWCMLEFMSMVDQCPNAQCDPGRFWVGDLEDVRFSQTNPADKTIDFTRYWREKAKKYAGDVETEAEAERVNPSDIYAVDRVRKRYTHDDWMNRVSDPIGFGVIKAVLSGNHGWEIHSLTALEDSDVWVLARTKAALAAVDRPLALFEIAQAAWKASQGAGPRRRRGGSASSSQDQAGAEARAVLHRHRAMLAFARAVSQGDPDGQPDGLRAVLERNIGEPTLDDIRRCLLEYYQGLCKDDAPVNCQELQERLDQEIQGLRRRVEGLPPEPGGGEEA